MNSLRSFAKKVWHIKSSKRLSQDCIPRIRRTFISPPSSITTNNNTCKKPGLFSIEGLHQPPDFIELAKRAMNRCDAIRSSLHRSSLIIDESNTVDSARSVLVELDALSNEVCSVIDAAELCRCVHPSHQWRTCAEGAFQLLSDYIADMNTDTSIYNALCQVATPPIIPLLTEEEQRFVSLLKAEFERDGIHLSAYQRKQVKQLQTKVTQLETTFSSNITNSQKFFSISPATDVHSILPPHVLHEFVPHTYHSTDEAFVTISTDAQLVNSLLKYSSNSAIRKQVFLEANTACPENLAVLEELRLARHELATTLGYNSYAERFLQDKMAQSPQTVLQFLNQMSVRIQRGAKRDYELLLEAKRRYEDSNSISMEPWDIPFYTGLVKSQLLSLEGSSLTPYFSMENCLDGITILLQKLFGIQLVEEKVCNGNGELWYPTVRKLSLHHETEGMLGTIYLDLYPRPDKYVHAAHFTIRCGCTVDSSSSGTTKSQLPIVALVTNFSSNNGSNPNHTLLSHAEVETLFHELGHALHSLLSRTKFQHLSGTRCAVDFVETPSHWMENYIWDTQFLQMFAKHYLTGTTIPTDLVTKLSSSRYLFQCLEIQTQILYAQLDQALFGDLSQLNTPSIQLLEDLHRKYSIPYAKGTHWHTKFGHLITYGAGYYGYLYDQAFAADIWNQCFRENPLSRSSGDKMRTEILIHGGAMDPEKMLKGMLGRKSSVEAFFESIKS